ncbi:MAG TPA: ABC transporter ATP-binding protein [Tepidisphaeraceae bacterium]|nr:ABC transporter ATP-binding protein [Tepidisphaeraceae bacterium]HEV8604420.1 ABC transporter ATP-binding protein [Tepidisphaeraceae bacterium]
MARSELTTPPPLPETSAAAGLATAPAPAPTITPPPLAADKSAAIATNLLTKRYGSLMALDALSLHLNQGDVFGFIGPNGAGKSTTMKILAGLLSPTSGSATVLGKNVINNGEFIRRSVGYMPDSFGVYEDLKVCEYLEFFASAYGIPRKQRRKIVQDVLELTDLKYKQDAFVDSLSRGMQQRLGLARVLVHDPPILLLDEPASGLDPRARIEIRELLRELQRLGKTIMISSHILSELGEFCNKLGIIERGKLIISGTIDELMAMARAHPVISIRLAPQAQHELERAIAVLKTDARVNDVDVIGSELQVTLTDPRVHHFFLMEKFVSANIPLDSVAPHQMKLEDVFLRLTKGIVQ